MKTDALYGAFTIAPCIQANQFRTRLTPLIFPCAFKVAVAMALCTTKALSSHFRVLHRKQTLPAPTDDQLASALPSITAAPWLERQRRRRTKVKTSVALRGKKERVEEASQMGESRPRTLERFACSPTGRYVPPLLFILHFFLLVDSGTGGGRRMERAARVARRSMAGNASIFRRLQIATSEHPFVLPCSAEMSVVHLSVQWRVGGLRALLDTSLTERKEIFGGWQPTPVREDGAPTDCRYTTLYRPTMDPRTHSGDVKLHTYSAFY